MEYPTFEYERDVTANSYPLTIGLPRDLAVPWEDLALIPHRAESYRLLPLRLVVAGLDLDDLQTSEMMAPVEVAVVRLSTPAGQISFLPIQPNATIWVPTTLWALSELRERRGQLVDYLRSREYREVAMGF